MLNNFATIAKIIGPHGKKNKLRILVFIDHDIFRDLLLGGKIFLADSSYLNVLDVSFYQEFATVALEKEFQGLDFFTNKELFVARDEVLEDGEVLASDLMGLRVMVEVDAELVEYGYITDFMNYGAGDIFEITANSTDIKELFLWNDSNFPKMDLRAGYVVFCRPEFVLVESADLKHK